MAEPTKETIYVDIDDEITAIIDKVRGSGSKVLALVLPKRATVLQSIVNMKLLKRTADDAKKHLVLITTEIGLLPLAGAVGMHVAKTLTSRPEIPAPPEAMPVGEELVDEDEVVPLGDEPITAANAGDRPIGELAGAAVPAAAEGIETVELDDDAASPVASEAPEPKPKKDKKLSVPSFDRFRLGLILGVALLIILIVGGYLAFAVLPKATIAIKTDASNVNTSVSFTLDTTTNSLNATNSLVPAKQVTEQKTFTGTANATGQKNEGNKANGSVTMTAGACGPTYPSDVPSGSGISAGGITYITQQDTSFTAANAHGHCVFQSNGSTAIAAQNAGSNGNQSSDTSFTVAGRSDVSASGSASGGTDNNVQVVAQADIDSATSKISAQDSSVEQDLENQLQGQNLYAINATFSDGTPATSDSANVGDQASSVTVTETITYTMLGAAQADLKTLVDNDIKSQINSGQQGILSEGITQAGFKLVNATANGAAMTLQTTADVGPNINIATIKQQAAGKKSGDIESAIKSDPDVTDVQVHLSPFWVAKAPSKLSKITVTIAKPTTAANSNND